MSDELVNLWMYHLDSQLTHAQRSKLADIMIFDLAIKLTEMGSFDRFLRACMTCKNYSQLKHVFRKYLNPELYWD